MAAGPLAGVKVVEIAGIGPAPFAAMLLADLGAAVLSIERREGSAIARSVGLEPSSNILGRGRVSVALDLKHPAAIQAVLEWTGQAEMFIEGFRPGVMERLGLGPDACQARNPRLVYGRMTGWGQTGPLAQTAGHDINYIAVSGVLHTFARAGEAPVPPGNLVGDMGGGGLLLAFGLVSALLEARSSGRGQVVDAAMFEGAALLGSAVYMLMATRLYDCGRPGTHFSDLGSHFYNVYRTSDDKYVAVGAIEPQFYARLLEGLGLDPATLPKQMDAKSWPAMRQRFAELFLTGTRQEWEGIFAGTDACVSPVLTPLEAAEHPQARARESFASPGGVLQPAPAPRFSRTPAAAPSAPDDTAEAGLQRWGVDPATLAHLRNLGILG